MVTPTQQHILDLFRDRTAPDGSLVRENFTKWFGNSKVVDAVGKPLVVFHGTERDFSEFNTSRAGSHFGTAEQANSRNSNRGQVLSVYLSIQSPARLPDLNTWSSLSVARALVEGGYIGLGDLQKIEGILDTGKGGVVAWIELKTILKTYGYDGIVYANKQEGEGDSYIAFSSLQIKSAVGNSGLFDANSSSYTDSHVLTIESCEPSRERQRT